MKNLNVTKIGLIVGLLIIAFGFVSCSNDDDIIATETETTTSINNETLKGTWYSNVVKNEEGTDIRWVINIDNERMDKYIQYKNGDVWEYLQNRIFAPYTIKLENSIFTGQLVEQAGAISGFLALGLNEIDRALLEQRKQEHNVLKILSFNEDKLKIELLEESEAQELTFEKGEPMDMLEITHSITVD